MDRDAGMKRTGRSDSGAYGRMDIATLQPGEFRDPLDIEDEDAATRRYLYKEQKVLPPDPMRSQRQRPHTAADTRMRGTEDHSRLSPRGPRSAASTAVRPRAARSPWSPATKLVPGSPEAIKTEHPGQGSSLFIKRKGKVGSVSPTKDEPGVDMRDGWDLQVMKEWRMNMQLVNDRLVLLETEKEAAVKKQERTLQAEVEQLKLANQRREAANRDSTAVVKQLLKRIETAEAEAAPLQPALAAVKERIVELERYMQTSGGYSRAEELAAKQRVEEEQARMAEATRQTERVRSFALEEEERRKAERRKSDAGERARRDTEERARRAEERARRAEERARQAEERTRLAEEEARRLRELLDAKKLEEDDDIRHNVSRILRCSG